MRRRVCRSRNSECRSRPPRPSILSASSGRSKDTRICRPANKVTKYEHILPQLVMIEQDPEIKDFVLLMNTAGGDVEAGLALAEMIAGMRKPSVSLILGGGHSIGLTLAVSADYSYISPTARRHGASHPHERRRDRRAPDVRLPAQDAAAHRRLRPARIRRLSNEEYRRLMMLTGEMANDCRNGAPWAARSFHYGHGRRGEAISAQPAKK